MRLRSALVLVPMFAACGHSERATSRAPNAPSDDAVPLYAELCRFIARCEPQLLELFTGSTVEACVEWATCADAQSSWTRRFDDAQGCVNFVREAACDELPVRFNPAPTLSAGLTMVGVEFDAGAACQAPTAVASGTNTALQPGETCFTAGEGVSCTADSFCEPWTPAHFEGLGLCGTCTPRATTGEACSSDLPCTRPDRCVAGVCGTGLELGASCTSSSECAEGYCDDGTCAELSEPIVPGYIVHHDELLGQPCDPYSSYDPCHSTPFTVCVDDTCMARVDVGQPCIASELGSQCRAGQVCHDGVCTAVGCTLELGEPCEGYSCSHGLCDEATNRCVPYPTLGEPCEAWCQDPYVCNPFGNGVCMALVPNGGGCKESAECVSRFCDRDYSPYCDVETQTCVVPACDEVCGTCSEPPTRADCQ